jgi:ureidoglycolate dehydrogenase (NAD+)
MNTIKIEDLKTFCKTALTKEGMREDYAAICAEVLVETDAFGTHSHGTKNLHNYIKKCRVGGADLHAEPEIVVDKPAFAIIDAHNTLGMIPSYLAMNLACDKAKQTGLALVTVKNSCHFGAAGYYANIAARRGMIGLSMSNVDPNMTAPGAKGMLIGNNPLAYAAPLQNEPSVFLDIAMSNVASLKVIQARKDGKPIPDTWIVDKDGLPTTDPSHYPEEGAMQPMAAHKGYGLAILIELLTGVLAGGGMSMMGDIVSWVFQMDKPNHVCHTFIAVDAEQFIGQDVLAERMQGMQERLHQAPKARGSTRIFTPGEIEWGKHAVAGEKGLTLPDDVLASLQGLAQDCGVELKLY